MRVRVTELSGRVWIWILPKLFTSELKNWVNRRTKWIRIFEFEISEQLWDRIIIFLGKEGMGVRSRTGIQKSLAEKIAALEGKLTQRWEPVVAVSLGGDRMLSSGGRQMLQRPCCQRGLDRSRGGNQKMGSLMTGRCLSAFGSCGQLVIGTNIRLGGADRAHHVRRAHSRGLRAAAGSWQPLFAVVPATSPPLSGALNQLLKIAFGV